MSTCTAERNFSGTERLQTPLQMTTDYRSEIEFSCNSAFEHKDVIDFDGIIKGFCLSEGYTSRPLLVTSLPFLP